jgi:hypothetical protein
MFDGISLNLRMVGSMLGTKQNLRVRTDPSAEDARQQMKFGVHLLLLGMTYY